MPSIRQLAKGALQVKNSKKINWHPGHMYSGMKAMIGKLNTVDCVIEVHDARIPLIGRNQEFRQHLGQIKPHLLVLNKADLADLTKWKEIKEKLYDNGDRNVLLTDLSGSSYSKSTRGYDKLLDKAVKLINESDRFNRFAADHFKIMIVGIPNVGKSTLINRLRQHHLGKAGEATKTGNEAGVTRNVEFKIKICSRPLIYSLDTPGVLEPNTTKNHDDALKLALCSTINDKILDPEELVNFILENLNGTGDTAYQFCLGLDKALLNVDDLIYSVASGKCSDEYIRLTIKPIEAITAEDRTKICWKFVKIFRSGRFGKIMFDHDSMKDKIVTEKKP